MTFFTAVPLEARVEMEILGPRPALRSTPVVETVEGGIAEDVQPTLDSDGRSWVDPASELREILPEHLLAICENDRGHDFAQAFRVGTGNARRSADPRSRGRLGDESQRVERPQAPERAGSPCGETA